MSKTDTGGSAKKIFSGEHSRLLWLEINQARSKRRLRLALYSVCCYLQELEAKFDKAIAEKRKGEL